MLYHYTSAEGLLGMLGTPRNPPEIWLTQIQYMNDAEDFYHALKIAGGVAREFHQKDRLLGTFLDGQYLFSANDSAFSGDPRDDLEFKPLFVFSLTTKGDVLSQWRGYTPRGGYSLEFGGRALDELAKSNGFRLIPCLYDDRAKGARMREAAEERQADLDAGRYDPDGAYSETWSEHDRIKQSALRKFRGRVLDMAASFKHVSFEEEQEWRIVGRVEQADPRMRWRTKGSLILPYCIIDGPRINVVVTGPGVDITLAHRAILSTGPRHLMEFGSSGSPYRP